MEQEKKLYPKEIVAVKDNKSTFCITAEFVRSKKEDGESLTIFTPFSRYVMTLINEEKQFVTANFPLKELAEMKQKSDYANMEHLKYLYDNNTKNENANKPKAYTVKITAGYLKGKTPAEALFEDSKKNAEILNNQYAFLQKNLAKYPKNKEQMDAIVEAAKLLKEGKLNANDVSKSKRINMYNAPIRPLTSRKKGNTYFVYSINIDWIIGSNSPIEVTIENYYAPVIKKEDGTLNVMVKEKTDSKKIMMAMSTMEWNNVLERMFETKNSCSALFFPKCFQDAIMVDNAQRQKYVAEK